MSRLPPRPLPGCEIEPADRIIFRPDEDGRQKAKDQIPPFAPTLFDQADIDRVKPAQLIPTGWREQLGKGTSYPIGAEAVSRALAGLWHFERASLSLNGFDRWSPGRDEPIHVLGVYFYEPARAWRLARDGEAASWHVDVYAVPQALRHVVRVALLESGLPFLRRWLLNIGKLEGRDGQIKLRIRFRDDELLVAEETVQLKPRLSRTSLAIR